MRVDYDADHNVLYVYLPNHPDVQGGLTKGCVKQTEMHQASGESYDNVLFDIGHDDEIIGIELLLSGPLSISSGDTGVTKTGSLPRPCTITSAEEGE